MHRAKGKESAMKEIKKLAIKNECFVEIYHEPLTQEMKNRGLPSLILIAMKRSGDLKSRECSNGSYQKICTGKSECSSPTSDFCSLKYECGIITKEARDVVAVDILGFFLKTKRDDEELLLLKMTSVVDLLLAESELKK